MKKVTILTGALFLATCLSGQATPVQLISQNGEMNTREQNRPTPPQKNYKFWQRQNRYVKPTPPPEEEEDYGLEEHGGAGGGGR